MDIINRDELKKQILEKEKLMPGDKLNSDRLIEIAKKYEITPYILATNILGVTQTAYNGLNSNSTNSKNVVILKDEIPEMIKKAIDLRETILENETLKAGDKINYNELEKLSEKYKIREKYLAVHVFDIQEYTFRKMKSDKNYNAIILHKEVERKKDIPEESENIKNLREKILSNEHIKFGDRINYESLNNLSKKYNVSIKVLALEVFHMADNSYYKLKHDKNRNGIILKDFLSKDNLDKIRDTIIKKEQLQTYDQISYEELLQIAERHNINDRILATEILGISVDQYYNIKHSHTPIAIILKDNNKGLSIKQLRDLRKRIFEEKGLSEGYRISFEEIETIQKQYNIQLKELLYILGITKYSYNFIKGHNYYKSIVKDTDKLMIFQIISRNIEKNKSYSVQELEEICKKNKIDMKDFLNYVVGKSRYFGYEEYQKVLDTKGEIWIGDKCALSEEFAKKNVEKVQNIARIVARYICKHNRNSSNKLEKDDLVQDACLYILSYCGDLEKNFENEDLTRMIYLRTRINFLKKMSMKSKVKVKSTTMYYMKKWDKDRKKNSDLVLLDKDANTEETAIQNLDTKNNHSIIDYLSHLLEQGYDRDSALEKTSQKLGVTKEEMLKAMQEELLKKGKVKETKSGEYILGD